MTNLTILAAKVAPVRYDESDALTLPVVEAVSAGQYVRVGTDGKFTKGNATSPTEVGTRGYFALRTAAFIGEAITALRKGLVNVGTALSGMAVGAKVWLSATDGTFADADPGANEIQTLTITGTPTGGDFTLTYAGQTTAAIAYNAAASAVQSALELLSTIRAGNVKCGGGALPGAAVTVEFVTDLEHQNVALITGTFTGLTGGTPAGAITETQAGVQSVCVGTVAPAWGATTVDKLLDLDLTIH